MEISAKNFIFFKDSETTSLEAVYSSLHRENDPKDLEDPQGRLQFINDRSCFAAHVLDMYSTQPKNMIRIHRSQTKSFCLKAMGW
jgi:hypothetical protein